MGAGSGEATSPVSIVFCTADSEKTKSHFFCKVT